MHPHARQLALIAIAAVTAAACGGDPAAPTAVTSPRAALDAGTDGSLTTAAAPTRSAGRLVYVLWAANVDIYVRNADGTGTPTNLTNSAGIDMTPAPSPDGTKIAFTSDRDGNYEIYVMNADGTGATRLTTNAAMDVGPTWSPDGRKIAFMSDRDGDGEIYVMNADGSSVVQLTTNAASDGSPAWSPNGKQIAFASERDGNREIYVMNADGSGQTRLTNDPAYDDEPAWAPKGRARIAFESDRRLTDDDDIFVMGADGSRPVDVTPNNPSLDFESAWSPDARKIAFAGFLPGNAASIFVMNADGSGRTLLGPGEDPAWLP